MCILLQCCWRAQEHVELVRPSFYAVCKPGRGLQALQYVALPDKKELLASLLPMEGQNRQNI